MTSILHVDDESAFLEMVRRFLEKIDSKLSVSIISSPEQALKLLEEKKFDLIISDFDMPGLNGLDFLKKLRRDGHNVPFLMLTGKGTEEIQLQARISGVAKYMKKRGSAVALVHELYEEIMKIVSPVANFL
ncbi:MAG: response regulator [Candidatus Odinarchaeota archaeon]